MIIITKDTQVTLLTDNGSGQLGQTVSIVGDQGSVCICINCVPCVETNVVLKRKIMQSRIT